MCYKLFVSAESSFDIVIGAHKIHGQADSTEQQELELFQSQEISSCVNIRVRMDFAVQSLGHAWAKGKNFKKRLDSDAQI